MKKVVVFLSMFIFVVGCFCLFSCSSNNPNSFLRIHIRANSNSDEDQNIKYLIKDKVVDYITPIICESKTKNELIGNVNRSKLEIEQFINNILCDNGFDYKGVVNINNEFFPTRSYDGFTLEANYYDAIIINLGSGGGNNWWCVVYPPLCFTNQKTANGVVYKSKIVEIINKFFK